MLLMRPLSFSVSCLFRKSKVPFGYFPAGRSNFVKCAKTLENLKTSPEISDVNYKEGKYFIVVNDGDLILVNEKNSGKSNLIWMDFNGISALKNIDIKSSSIILDVMFNEASLKEVCVWAVNYSNISKDDSKLLAVEAGGRFISLRKSLFCLNDEESVYIMQAKGLINFCKTMNFCNVCAGELKTKSGGTQKECSQCKKVYYPSISPVGITLIENKDHSKVLLVRQGRHPTGMYSCVAGFIEPGESLEHNIHREIAEEVGLDVEKIEYVSSQHWALPMSQLMLGCIATVKDEDFELDNIELQDGKWIEASQLQEAVTRVRNSALDYTVLTPEDLWVPPENTQAHILMKTWLQKYHGYKPSSNL